MPLVAREIRSEVLRLSDLDINEGMVIKKLQKLRHDKAGGADDLVLSIANSDQGADQLPIDSGYLFVILCMLYNTVQILFGKRLLHSI